MHRHRARAVPSAGRPSARNIACLTASSMVFPVAAVLIAASTFFTTSPSPGIIALLLVALVPWLLLLADVAVPPLAVVLGTLAPTAGLVIGYNDQAALFLGVLACTWTAAAGPSVPAWTAVIGFSAVGVGCDLRHTGSIPNGWTIWATGMLFGWFAGTLLFRQRLLTDQLALARRELDVAAVEHERKAIAREVHDIVGHSLTVVLLNIAGARRNLAHNPAAAAEALERAEITSRESLDTVRSVVSLLTSDGETQRDAPLPGGCDVAPLLEQARTSGMPLNSTISGDPATLEPSIGLTLVRLLQEALANASRHAPGATVDVDVRVGNQSVDAVISNALPDATPTSQGRVGLGLASMHDRVAAVHGSIHVGADHGRWTVRTSLPRSSARAAELATS